MEFQPAQQSRVLSASRLHTYRSIRTLSCILSCRSFQFSQKFFFNQSETQDPTYPIRPQVICHPWSCSRNLDYVTSIWVLRRWVNQAISTSLLMPAIKRNTCLDGVDPFWYRYASTNSSRANIPRMQVMLCIGLHTSLKLICLLRSNAGPVISSPSRIELDRLQ